ncbi:hypothetical protein ACQ859_17785 [Roseateles chitinivorans]|uniref:hypothetical protein n=1 Tax=Roseateles chitinivorans TaxID=2917965 RepID=UPI003D66EDAF
MSALDDGWSLDPAADRPEARLAVRLAFIVAGCGIACVLALLPCLAHHLALDAAELVTAVLSLMAGAWLGTRSLGAGWSRIGARRQVLIAGLGSALLPPTLAFAGSPALLAAGLFTAGVVAGALDVAMQASAEALAVSIRQGCTPALRAVYGFAGAGGALVTTGLLAVGFEPPLAAALVAAPMMIAIVVAWPYLPEAPGQGR